MINKNYLEQKLEWVKFKIKQLDLMETKLADMRQLAEYSRDNILSGEAIRELTQKMYQLQLEVSDIEGQSKTFLSDAQ